MWALPMADAGGQIPEMIYEAGHSPVIVLFLRSRSVIIIQLTSLDSAHLSCAYDVSVPSAPRGYR